MRLIFALSPGRRFFELAQKCDVQHILLSFAFIKDENRLVKLLNGWQPKSITLDSGAFSVWSRGKTIDLWAYTLFAKKLRDKLSPNIELNVVNLDVLPGEFGRVPTNNEREQSAIKGWENMLKMQQEGLRVIHVYHQHEDLKWLDKIRGHIDYMGVSPANDCSMQQKLSFMDSVYARVKDTVKTHGFAVTSPDQLYRYPLYSADSTSWSAAARYGRIPLFYDDLSVKSLIYKNKKDVIKHWDYIKAIGIRNLAQDDWVCRTELAIRTFQKLEQVATDLWKKRGIVWT